MSQSSSNPLKTTGHLASRLTCAQCERMVQDALDGTLGPEDQAQFDFHLSGCHLCAKALGEAQRGAAWMEMLKSAPPEPPSTLVGSILAQTSGDPAVALPVLRAETILRPAPRPYAGNVVPFRAPVAQVWSRLPAMAQPRFAMTAAMAFFSVALTMNLTGVHIGDVHPGDLRPAALKRSFWGANAKVVRYYDNLRVVYELQSRVRELQRGADETTDRPPVKSSAPVTGTQSEPVEAEPRPQPRGIRQAPEPTPEKRRAPHAAEPQSGSPSAARPRPRQHRNEPDIASTQPMPDPRSPNRTDRQPTATGGEGAPA